MHPRCKAQYHIYRLILTVMVNSNVLLGLRYSSRIVETESGAIRGIIVELNSYHLEPVEVFRGVPYAAPPVGPLRFQLPQPPLPWTGTRLADSFGAVCPQKFPDIANKTAALQNMPRGHFNYLKKLSPLLQNQSEDCLFLNIYVPGNGNRGLEAPYAVLVFVHGDSFEWGAGHPYDGSVLASYGHVIAVTINFRLGILGFLRTRPISHRNEAENFGIADIAAALRWIKFNIAAFGGDPGRITLMGHGTGAALANLLFISPLSKGLIKRVVLLSGTALSPWAIVHNPDNVRISVGQQTGCLPYEFLDTTDDLAPCLRSRSLESLLNVQLEPLKFMPTIGPSQSGASQASDPSFAMEHISENFITCELMLGMTTTESYTDFTAAEIQYGFEEDQRNRILRTFVRNTYLYHLNEIFSAIKNEYTDWDKSIQHPINIRDSIMEALSDGHTVAPLLRVAYLHARRGARTYLFHFGYQTRVSDFPQRLGSIRGEDVTYVLGMPLVGGLPFFPQNFTKQDGGVAEALLNFLSNFAKNGDPNNSGIHIPDYETFREKTRFQGLTWEPYEVGTQYYLSITSKPKVRSHYRGHKMAVWLNLIPQLHQPGDVDVNMRHHHFHERDPHYYSGSVRAETFTRLPLLLHPASMTHHTEHEGSECASNSTNETESTPDVNISLIDDETGQDIFEKLSNRQYYSYTAALGITVGVGCLLLIINMLIFIVIYYQRDRDRRKQNENYSSRSVSSPSTESIAMSQRQSIPNTQTYQSSLANQKDKLVLDLPQLKETTVCPLLVGDKPKKEKPPPPVRTTSDTTEGIVKKRVHIQEISV